MPTRLIIRGDIALTAEPSAITQDGEKVFWINRDPFDVCDLVRAKFHPGVEPGKDPVFEQIMREREIQRFKRRNA